METAGGLQGINQFHQLKLNLRFEPGDACGAGLR
eukprot:gene18941-6296_t